MRLLRLWFILLLLAISTCAWAGHITGQVRLDSGQTVDNARVQLRSEMIAFQTETMTDRQGRFTFDGLPLSTFHLTVEFPGYQTYSAFIDISMSKMSREDVTLRRDHSKEAREVPPEGPNASVDARMAQITPEAKNEFQQGQKRSAANDPIGAITHFKKAIELFANYAEAFQLLGGI